MESANVVPQGRALVYDGVGVLFRADTCIIVYQKAARVHRTRWLFDLVENYLAENESDLLAYMLVLPTADAPDAETRRENTVRMRALGHRVRRLVTIPIGNGFKVNLVRAIMRSLNLALGDSGTHLVADTVDEGLSRLLQIASERTPTEAQIRTDIATIYRALGEHEPRFPSIHPGGRTER